MNEAMNNPDVINMMRNSPMLRNNPMAQAIFDNPEMRRTLTNPDFIRMQMQMQRTMGGNAPSFPAPGATDTTEQPPNTQTPSQQNQPQNPFAAMGNMGGMFGSPSGANPFAALFGGNPGSVAGSTPGTTTPAAQPTSDSTTSPNTQSTPQANPFASLFGAGAGAGAGAQGGNPMMEMANQMMQNPEMMRAAMNMMGSMNGAQQPGAGAAGGDSNANANPFGGFNPFAMGGMGGLGGMGGMGAPAAPADNRPPEERYSEQLAQLNAMGFYDFERNVRALRMSGGSVEGAVDVLFSGSI